MPKSTSPPAFPLGAEPLGPVPPTPPERLFTTAALERAWLAIKRAGGGAGMDGVTLAQFEAMRATELAKLRQLLISGAYRPQPLGLWLRVKPSGGLRPILLWALRDRIAQRVVYEIMAPAFESIFLPCSFGFRPGLGAPEAIAQLQHHRADNRRWVVHADIQECFDHIDAQRLSQLVAQRVQDPLLLRYTRLWLQAKLFHSADGVPRPAGASQGSALSPLLANIYLHQVDQQLLNHKLAYLRYADDFVICCQRRQEAVAALALARQSLAAWGLDIKERKTEIVHFDQGFTWLGYFLIRAECHRLSR